MKNRVDRKEIQPKPDLPSKEKLVSERAKMEKFILDRMLHNESLTSEDILIMSEAFDSLINEFMKKN
ncbi:MAG TPA: hypothetical protein VF941_24375 [Clostridia bacterium]